MLTAKAKKLTKRVAYFLRTGYIHSGERVNPDFPSQNFTNHLKVYKFLQQFAARKNILDVGCGVGYGSDLLSLSAASVTGIDISKSAIRLARSKYSRPKFLVMDAHHLEFPDATFDFVVSSENFEHLSNQGLHARELRRVLKPGGMAFIASPNPEVSPGFNRYHFKENTYVELLELFRPIFDNVEIIENSLPHNLDRAHGKPPTSPLTIFGQSVDTEHLSNTHSFFCFLA